MFGSMDFKRALAPRLLPLRRHQDPRWRIAALEVLVTLRCLPGVVEAIGDSLDDPDEAVRYAALWALRDLGEDGRAVVPALVRRLEDPTDHLRFLAADCLGGIGPAAQPAVPALLDLFRRTPDGRVRIARTLALLGGPAVREALPLLIAELARRLGDPEDCVDLAVTLSRFGAEARDAVPLLTALLANANTDIRRTALTALGTTGSAALPSAAAITARLGDAAAEPEERLAAAVALGRIGAADQDAVAALTQAQKADCPYLRLVATALLVRLGVPGAVPPVPAALPVQGKFALRAVAAADGLLDMLPQPGPVIIAFLAPLLENPEADSACAYFGEEALAVLTRLGPAARPVLPVIMRYALTTHPTARGEELLRLNPGLRVLVALGPDLALATLVESRGDPEMPYWGALQEGFLPFGARAVGPLLEVFKDEEFRPYAAEALGLLGPAARAAVPALRPLARSADPAVRAAAVRALLQIDPASAPPLR
jgi:HEAT repeat protein